VKSLTWKEVWGRRLARHALLAPRPKEELVEVVRDVCGIHAQVMPAAELSIGIRTIGVTRQDVQAELWQRRRLVKAHGPRGTVHLFPADELSLWIAALRANPQPNEARRLAEMGLEMEQVEVIVAAIGEALDGRRLTREELGQEVARRVGSWATDAVSPAFGGKWPRWLMALGAAANRGLLCFGPNEGQRVTFVRPDQWLGHSLVELDGTEALLEVLRRYLSTYGPVTHHEFARWFAMPPGRALALTRQLAGELEEVDVEGHRAWLPGAGATDAYPPVEGVVRLLPHFDCYLIGCHPRDRLVPATWAKRVLTRGSIGNLPLVLVDGVVAGLWQQQRRGQRLEIRVEVFQPLDPQQHQQLLVAVARVGEILEAESFLTLDTVDARPHL
jgi:hypothetical protein